MKSHSQDSGEVTIVSGSLCRVAVSLAGCAAAISTLLAPEAGAAIILWTDQPPHASPVFQSETSVLPLSVSQNSGNGLNINQIMVAHPSTDAKTDVGEWRYLGENSALQSDGVGTNMDVYRLARLPQQTSLVGHAPVIAPFHLKETILLDPPAEVDMAPAVELSAGALPASDTTPDPLSTTSIPAETSTFVGVLAVGGWVLGR